MGDTSTVVTSGGMSAVMSALDTVIQLMGKCWDLMTSNPLLALCVAAGLLPILLQGVRHIEILSRDVATVAFECRGSDADDFHVASRLSFLRGLRGSPLIIFVGNGKPCNHPAVYGSAPRGFLM